MKNGVPLPLGALVSKLAARVLLPLGEGRPEGPDEGAVPPPKGEGHFHENRITPASAAKRIW